MRYKAPVFLLSSQIGTGSGRRFGLRHDSLRRREGDRRTMSLEAREAFARPASAAPRAHPVRRRVGLRRRGVARVPGARFASPLTRRIVVLNLGGLVALLIGFL